jgi:hypothetical protein
MAKIGRWNASNDLLFAGDQSTKVTIFGIFGERNLTKIVKRVQLQYWSSEICGHVQKRERQA